MITFHTIGSAIKTVVIYLFLAAGAWLFFINVAPQWFDAGAYWGTVMGSLATVAAIVLLWTVVNFLVDVLIDNWRYKRGLADADRSRTGRVSLADEWASEDDARVRTSTILEIATLVRRRGRLELAAEIAALAVATDVDADKRQ